jgi:hypothetical protein
VPKYLERAGGNRARAACALLADMAALPKEKLYTQRQGPVARALTLILQSPQPQGRLSAVEAARIRADGDIEIVDSVLSSPGWQTNQELTRGIVRAAAANQIAFAVIHNWDMRESGERLARWTRSQPGNWINEMVVFARAVLRQRQGNWVGQDAEVAMFRFCSLMESWARAMPADHAAVADLYRFALPGNNYGAFNLDPNMVLNRALWAPLMVSPSS